MNTIQRKTSLTALACSLILATGCGMEERQAPKEFPNHGTDSWLISLPEEHRLVKVPLQEQRKQEPGESRDFIRSNFGDCLSSDQQSPMDFLDAYQTIASFNPFSCHFTPEEKWPEVRVERAFSANDRCYESFISTIRKDPHCAIASWVFYLTRRVHGPLGRPQHLTIKTLNSGETDKSASGWYNDGVYLVTGDGSNDAAVVKVFGEAEGAIRLAQRMLASPLSAECWRNNIVDSQMNTPEEFEHWMPHFVQPWAISLFASQAISKPRPGASEALDAGLAIMPSAVGTHAIPRSAGWNLGDLQSIEDYARAQGRAAALLHLPGLKDNEENIFTQRVWRHRDLHSGNTFVDMETWKVSYIDFGEMEFDSNWMGDVVRICRGGRAPPKSIHHFLQEQLGTSTGSCTERLADLVASKSAQDHLLSESRLWFQDQAFFLACRAGYLEFSPDFARQALTDAFEVACPWPQPQEQNPTKLKGEEKANPSPEHSRSQGGELETSGHGQDAGTEDAHAGRPRGD